MKNVRDSYRNYKQVSDNPIDINQYAKLNSDFAKFIMAQIFAGKEVKLPARMGTASIKGKKIEVRYDEQGRLTGFAPDWKATNELWIECPECKERKQLVFHLNEHTGGIRYKFFWSKDRMLVDNKTFYTLIYTRTNKRTLNGLITQGKEYYVEPNNY